MPVVAVLGNHDHHDDRGARIGVAGTKGFGGGFVGRCAGEFGEPIMKEFVRYSRRCADALCRSLEELGERDCDVRIALTHFSPVPDTLAGEPPEIYPFPGSCLLAEAIDTAGADLAVHGHAHLGTEHGMTSGGVRVRNVAQPVIGRAFHVYRLPVRERRAAGVEGAARAAVPGAS